MDLFSMFKRNKEIADMLDFEFISDTSERAYLKKMAIDTVLNFVARTMSSAQFRFKENGKLKNSDWERVLNVRPNSDCSATDFWEKFFYKLLNDNEVLVVKSDDNQLLIADSFMRTEYAVYEDTFSGVIVKDYQFNKVFKMSEVIYMEYNNAKLEDFTLGLFADYGELFGRILEVSMRNNQIRASVGVDATGSINNNGTFEKLNTYINNLYKTFKTSSVAIVPQTKGFSYEEYTNKMGVSNQSLNELNDMVKSLVADVARWVGVPTALILGENADLDSNLKAYRDLCLNPLKRKLQDELNAKLIDIKEYKKGLHIEVSNILPKDPLEYSEQADKLINAGIFTPNEVRELFEQQRKDLPELDKHYITKNYSNLKGGEVNEED